MQACELAYDLTHENETPYDIDPESARQIIIGILVRAFKDALGKCDTVEEKMDAIQFIDWNNKDFCFYCKLLGADPEELAFTMKKKIRQIKAGKLKLVKEGKIKD